MENNSNKLLFQCGVFTGIVCVLFLTLSLFIVLSRKNWEKGLKRAVTNLLPAAEYSVGDMISIDNKNDKAACFAVSSVAQKGSSDSMVLVMRITTYYGPLPAVFIHENNSTRFVGIAYTDSSIAKEFSQANMDRQFAFWNARAESIFKKAKLVKEGL